MPRPGVDVTIAGSSVRSRPPVPGPLPPEPILDPVADFVFSPAAPTTDDDLICMSTSTPAEHIERHTFVRLMPSGAT